MFAERHDTGYGFEVARLSFEVVDEAGAALDLSVGFELPGVDVAEAGGREEVAEVYEEFDVHDDFVGLCEVGHFADHGTWLFDKLAEVDSGFGPRDDVLVFLVDVESFAPDVWVFFVGSQVFVVVCGELYLRP